MRGTSHARAGATRALARPGAVLGRWGGSLSGRSHRWRGTRGGRCARDGRVRGARRGALWRRQTCPARIRWLGRRSLGAHGGAWRGSG
eukprot:22197-Eustigmatos_ZCMA.PRE.1